MIQFYILREYRNPASEVKTTARVELNKGTPPTSRLEQRHEGFTP